jgi:FAD/FMN-containing dehydrogenase
MQRAHLESSVTPNAGAHVAHRITRRGLLGASLASVAAASGLGRAASALAQEATPAASPAASTGPLAVGTPIAGSNLTAWADLGARLQGWLLRPGDPMYPAATIINATRFMTTMPQGIAVCASPDDVVTCVTWARETGIPFAIRSGGHNYAGYSNSSGLVIDVRPMNQVVADQETGIVTVGGGANNADAGRALGPAGLYVAGGRCPTVGVSGLTLGGGWGFSNRHLGLTCDNLLSTELVTASGELVTASATENPDLFWAVRGAAGGNFGVHTSFTFQAVPTRDVTVFNLRWRGGDSLGLLLAIQDFHINAPREVGMRTAVSPVALMPASGAPGPLEITLLGLAWDTAEAVTELLAPIVAIQAPDRQSVQEMSFPAARDALATETPNGTYDLKNGFATAALPEDVLAGALDDLQRMPGVPSRVQESTFGFFGWGGAVSDPAPDAMAFVHRDAVMLVKTEILWNPLDDPGLIAANIQWNQEAFARLEPYLTGAYQNFPDRSRTDWAEAYYGSNLPRLRQVKRDWDPGNLFQYGQSIPPA